MSEQTTLHGIGPEHGMIPETWLRFYNGPNAGLVDVESAKREMPWILGVSPVVTLGPLATNDTISEECMG